MQITIDHIEEDYLVVELEDMTTIDISRKLIPDAKEGDVIDIIKNSEATLERKKQISDLMDDLFID